jgi:SM-20-related protein
MLSRISEESLSHLHEQEWLLLENFFPEETLQNLFQRAQNLWQEGAFLAAKVGRGSEQQQASEVRSDWTHWVDLKDPNYSQLAEQIESLQNDLNRHFYLGAQSFECHLARYSQGQFYDRHIDQSPSQKNQPGSRILSFVLYLNPNWNVGDGGELCLYHHSPEIRIEPRWGRLALFRADTVPHAVMKSLKDRWSLTGWFRRA